MPRAATGSIESYEWKDGQTVTWRLRFRANGARHRIDLGTNHEGWSEERARVELERILGQVQRGTWEPASSSHTNSHASSMRDETVHVTASRWWQRRERELRPNTRADYRWRLDFILGELAREPTSSLTVQRVDAFREHLAGEKALSARSVNMVLDLLAQVLDDAVEYELLTANPARGRRRRMRVKRPTRSFLEPDMVSSLLDVSGHWEGQLPEHQRYGRRSLLALLCLGGPRISEAIAADRGEFDLEAGRWRIPASKTDAGERDVELSAFLVAELEAHVAAMRSRGRPLFPRSPMWPTRTGHRLNPSNLRTRLLAESVEKANEDRGERMQLPAKVTPHTLRRTFASLAFLAGRDPRWVMGQLGHADARLTLAVYAQTMQRQRVDRDLVWGLMRFADESKSAPNGTRSGPTAVASVSDTSATLRGE